jgi:hydroxymethylbilane synthase
MRLGTRGSALALTQAGWVAERIDGPVEILTVTTSGDLSAAAGGDKSRWVSELERALLAGEIDVAVHSAKDVPGELAPGLELVAIPERVDPRDAICGAESLDALPTGAVVGTSSLRRRAQLLALRPDLKIVAVRGNVDTRLRKLAEGECDALVLAVAGLVRLGRDPDGILDLVPAAGQGALAIEARERELTLPDLVDADATACVTAERELTAALGASCDTPVGTRARVLAGRRLELSAWAGLPDGSEWLSDQLAGDAHAIAAMVAERMLAAGADELLARASRSTVA